MTTTRKSFTPLTALERFDFPAYLDKKYRIDRGNTWAEIERTQSGFRISVWAIKSVSYVGTPGIPFGTEDFLELIRRNPVLQDYQLGLNGRAKHALIVILDGKTPNAFIAPLNMLKVVSEIPKAKAAGEIRRLASQASEYEREKERFDQASEPKVSDDVDYEYDVFICHASEDKEEVAERLARVLMKEGLKVWYDEFTLKVGDSLRQKIDYGLAHSRYGIVILSQLFFKKNWPQRELDGLAAREDSEGRKVILPVWHNINRDYVLNYSPTLADRLASKTADGLEVVLKELLEVITEDREPSKREVNSNKAGERDQTSDFTLNDTAWAVLDAAQGSFADAMSTEEIIRTTGLDRTLVFQTCVILRDTRYLVFTDEFKDMAMLKITGLGLQTIKAADKFRSKPSRKNKEISD